jgi:hypothetical protein
MALRRNHENLSTVGSLFLVERLFVILYWVRKWLQWHHVLSLFISICEWFLIVYLYITLITIFLIDCCVQLRIRWTEFGKVARPTRKTGKLLCRLSLCESPVSVSYSYLFRKMPTVSFRGNHNPVHYKLWSCVLLFLFVEGNLEYWSIFMSRLSLCSIEFSTILCFTWLMPKSTQSIDCAALPLWSDQDLCFVDGRVLLCKQLFVSNIHFYSTRFTSREGWLHENTCAQKW